MKTIKTILRAYRFLFALAGAALAFIGRNLIADFGAQPRFGGGLIDL